MSILVNLAGAILAGKNIDSAVNFFYNAHMYTEIHAKRPIGRSKGKTGGRTMHTSSLADKVYDALENAILDGRYAPGDYVTEVRVSQELGVSRTPVREAVRRLTQEGLLQETARGALVLGVLPEDVGVIYEIRARIEGYAARLFTQRVTQEMLEALEENLELQAFYLMRDSAGNARDLDTRFHEILYQNCGSRILEDMLSSLHNKARRFRRASYEDHERAKRAVAEHRDILAAIRAQDGALVETLMTRHVKNAGKSIMANLKNG